MSKQKVIRVSEYVNTLNDHLEHGWRVVRVDRIDEYLFYLIEEKTIKDERREKLEQIEKS